MWGVTRKFSALQTRQYSINLTVKVALSKLVRRKPLDYDKLSGNPGYQFAAKEHQKRRGERSQKKHKIVFRKTPLTGKTVLQATLDHRDIESIIRRSKAVGLKPIGTKSETSEAPKSETSEAPNDDHPTSDTIITSESQLVEPSAHQPTFTLVKNRSGRRSNQTRDFFKIRYDPDIDASSSMKLDFRTNLTERVHSISRKMARPSELNILQWQGRGFSSTWTLKREAREGDKAQQNTRPEDDTNSRALQMRKWYRRLYKKLNAGSDMTDDEKDEIWLQMMEGKSSRSKMSDNWYTISSNLASNNWYHDSKIEELQNVSSVIPHFEYSYPHHNPGKVYPKNAKIQKDKKKKKKK